MAKSKLDAYKDLLGDMTDEKLVELTGYKMVTVQKYRAKHAAQLEEAIAEVSDLTGVAPDELEEAPEGEDAADELERELERELEKVESEQDARDTLGAMLEKNGFEATYDNINELLETGGPEEAVALMLSWQESAEPVEPEASPVPKNFATKRTVVITRNGGTMKIGMSEFFGERAAAVWAMLSEDDRRDLTKDHVY